MKLLDILYSNNVDFKISNNILDPNEGYVPIAVKIIEKNFLGDNEPARWVSLKYMFFNKFKGSYEEQNNFRENAKHGIICYSCERNEITPYIGMTWDETTQYEVKHNLGYDENNNEIPNDYTNDFLHNTKYTVNQKRIIYHYDLLKFKMNKTYDGTLVYGT